MGRRSEGNKMSELEVFSPYDRSLICSFKTMGISDVEQKLSVAHELARKSTSVLSIPKRIEILEKMAGLIEARAEDYAQQASLEGGKPLADSRVEISRAIQGVRDAARSIGHLVGRRIPMNLNEQSSHRLAYTQREPIGVVVAVSAFNHPFNLIIHQVVPAVAVGCPVIIKPAKTTPISCVNVLTSLYESGLPEPWAQLVICEDDVATKLVTDPRVDFFSFVGSGKVGWWLRSRLAPGTRCALEHGGAAPVIFDESGDVQEAIPLLLKGGFYHAGQVCVSVQRIFTHESRVEELTQGLVDGAKALSLGDPFDEKTQVGPLILEREVDRVHTWVREAETQGAQVLCGGERLGVSFFSPTVLFNPSQDSRVSREEIFGPVINIYPYSDRAQAIDLANSLPFSFQASLFTRDLDVALEVVNQLDATAVMVNDHTAFRVDWMPFAGGRQSGLGVGGTLPTMEEMTREKLVVYKSKVL